MTDHEIHVSTWEECEEKIREIESANSANDVGWWFRGQSKASWRLATTLKRRTASTCYSIRNYYNMILRIKPAIETFTGNNWEMPSFEQIQQLTNAYEEFDRKLAYSFQDIGYGYISHLRHNRFPSPLLDWSRSSYVAAYFAFATATQCEPVAIYLFLERPQKVKFWDMSKPSIYGLGQYVKTHKRHFLQHSTYTICAKFIDSDTGWNFCSHNDVFSNNPTDQDVLWKIVIPACERTKVLKFLDKFNWNAFSMFDSEESLLQTLALREIDLKPPTPLIAAK